MKRWPGSAATGAARRSCASAVPPGESSVRPSTRATAQGTWAVPTWRSSRDRWRMGRGAPSRSAISTSRMEPGGTTPGWASACPREIAPASTPGRFTAVRWPAEARGAAFPWTCTVRARSSPTAGEGGTRTSASPSETVPERMVPVTTVPNPFSVKARSTGRSSGPSAGRSATSAASASTTSTSRGSPSPVRAETGTMAADSRKVPAQAARISSSSSGSQSVPRPGSRSLFVTTTAPRVTPSSRQMSRCSRVWGMTPSSAATTSSTRSTPLAPAAMARTKRSWPGTSTTPATVPLGRGRWAKPSSMVIPRRFSSASRSVSTPVRARTSAVLPWSM